MSNIIDPATVNFNPEDVEEHRNRPTLVRDHVLNLPDGYSLFYFCKIVLRYDDLDPRIHGALCEFLEHSRYGRFRDATVPRSWFKTSIATIGKAMWLSIRKDANIRILIAMNTADNAEKRIHVIKHHWMTNSLLQQAFPELVPDFKHTRWSNSCAEIRRQRRSEEGTYEAIGSGGAVVSRHYDHIVEDDLIYASKDDLTGAEIQPNREDIEKAIGWHKLTYSLFSDPAISTLDNIGTRWAVHDLKDWIRNNEEKRFRFFTLSALDKDGEPNWPKRFGKEVLDDILDSQKAYMFSTQYLNLPRDPADALFNPQWLQYYRDTSEVTKPYETATFVDLALWGDTKGTARNVILTIARDVTNHIWLLQYDRGKYNPTQVIDLMEAHTKRYNSKVYIEEVYYQKAIRHYAIKRMEETGFKYSLIPLRKDNSKGAKENRIRTIEPEARGGFLHIKYAMKEFVKEYCDYPSALTVDILDCLGYATQRKLPRPPDKPLVVNTPHPFSLETVLKEIEGKNKATGYPFSLQCKKGDNRAI